MKTVTTCMFSGRGKRSSKKGHFDVGNKMGRCTTLKEGLYSATNFTLYSICTSCCLFQFLGWVLGELEPEYLFVLLILPREDSRDAGYL